MTEHPMALTLALLLNGRPRQDEHEFETQDVIDALFSNYSDEKKADLYSLLIEEMHPDKGGMPMLNSILRLRGVCSRCLIKNDMEFTRG